MGGRNPRIGFATLCRGRAFHLKETLPKNIADAKDYRNAVVTVLDYGDREGLAEYIKTEHRRDLNSGHLVYYSLENADQFRLAHGKNISMRCAMLEGATLCCVMDADNYGGPGFTDFIADTFSEPAPRPGIFLCPDYLLIKSLPHGALRPARGYAGRMVCDSQTFIKMGAMDEIFEVWRGEDIDFSFRLLRAGYEIRHIPNRFLGAINHGAAVRFREYPHAQQYEDASQIAILKARTETVVNFGRFGLGTVHRNFDPTPIELEPLPTRIFGVGLQKSATTSLHEAFKILGFDSLHWGAGEAPLIWYEMNALGRSPTLEQWYALSDNPIPILFKQIDKAYPGSKYVLTIRNEADWLESVRKLWSYEHNPTRHLWDVYPISNQLHTALYGRADFDAQTFLERYRRHNAEVRKHFRYRPNDLLVMDMDKGGDWAALCAFLKRPIPDVPYPRSNRSKELSAMTT